MEARVATVSESEAAVTIRRTPGLCVLAVARLTPPLHAALLLLARHREDVPLLVVDADAAVALSERYQISEEPTILYLRFGVEVGRLVGQTAPGRMMLALDCASEAPPGAEQLRGE